MQKQRFWTVGRLAIVCIAFVISCSKSDSRKNVTNDVTEKPPPATLKDFDHVSMDAPTEMSLVVTEGNPVDEKVVRAAPASVKPLTKAEAQKVLSRLPAIQVDKSDQVAFAKREKSLPPPKTGDIVKAKFPSDKSLAPPVTQALDNGPLKVLRKQPEGKVPIVPQLSVTFNQPMVNITSHADTIADGVPVTLTPKPEGKWRWIGSKTLLFEPDSGRFPMATKFKVEVPKGTTSTLDKSLATAESWEFETPPPAVENRYPNSGTYGLDQVMYMQFNQEIDPAKILEHIEVKAGVFTKANIVLAEPEKADADPALKQMIANAKPNRFVAFRTVEPLPYDSNITVTLKKGAPSAEGPLTTESDTNFSFKTYGPFKVIQNQCGYRGCRPNDSFTFRLSNRIDAETFDEQMIKIEPSFPSMNVQQHGDWIYINGNKPGRRKYTITLGTEIKDEFDQNLTGERTFTYDVGASDPNLYGTSGIFSVLDPASPPTMNIFTTNYAEVELTARRVDEGDWAKYTKWIRDYNYYGKKKITPPGKKIFTRKVKIDAEPDDLVETNISLKDAYDKNGRGNVVVFLRPTKTTRGSTMPKYRPELRSWLQSTQIGLDAFVDANELLGWATTLKNGEPMSGVELSLYASGSKATSDNSGTASIALPAWTKSFKDRSELLVAKTKTDTAFLPKSMWGGDSAWVKQSPYNTLGWYVFDDRKMYKPDEEVTVKGWVRLLEQKEGGGIRLDSGATRLTYVVNGPQGNKLTDGKATIGGLGGFDFKFKLPKTPNLGFATVRIAAQGSSGSNSNYTHSFQIQEFRTPEFEVKTNVEGDGPFLADASAVATVNAKYYAGGALPGAQTNWNVYPSLGSYRPPNNAEYVFGTWTPWWFSRNNNATQNQLKPQQFSAKTDASGAHSVKMEFGKVDPPRPISVSATATVMDVNRQAWTSSTSLIVHPSNNYVGLKTEKYFVKKGTPLDVDLVVTNIDGEVSADRPVKVRATRVDYRWKRGNYEEVERDAQTCEKMSNADGVLKCSFETAVGGQYKIAATTTDDYGRLNYSQITRWVSGGKRPKSRRVDIEPIQLIPDKDDYQPGETAEILVQSPIVPAEGIMTIRRHGIVETKRFTMKEATTVLSVPIKQGHVPNLYVNVDLVGSQPRLDAAGEPDEKLPRRPAIAKGALQLKVPPTQRMLALEIKPNKTKVEPGGNVTVDVAVKNAAGQIVPNAEVAIVVVDEAILALSNYTMADPMNIFYATRPAGVTDYHLRPYIQLVDPTRLQTANAQSPPADKSKKKMRPRSELKRKSVSKRDGAPAPAAKMFDEPMEESEAAYADEDSGAFGGSLGMEKNGGGSTNTAIAVRSNFNPLAAFSPAVKTNAQGIAKVSVKMPDNLTRYRIMAVAVKDATHYGTAESNVTARLPLMVRPSLPRFLNFGDKFEMPVVVQNQTDEALNVHVATRTSNLNLTSANGYSVSVPANDRVEVRFPATTDSAGRARFQLAAAAGKWADAASGDLPVWTPSTSEAFATYGVIDKGAIAQPVRQPTEVWPQFGGVQVTTSSTALQALTDAFLYLYHYDYQCAEQISSRMVSVAALRDVLTAFKADGMPTASEVKVSMSRDIEELTSRQNYDGGFGFWRKGQRSWPYVTIHATHALVRAKDKGYSVPSGALSKALRHLKNIEQYIPGWYHETTRRHIIAYSLYVRNVAGDKDAAKGRALIKRAGGLKGLSFASVGWLLGVLTGDKNSKSQITEIRRYLNNRVTETAGNAHFASQTRDGDYVIMHSDRVADGVILESMISDQPKADLIPKIVSGLMAHRKRGRWGNTQENAFILLALDKYFNTFEKQTPNFMARVWLGDTYAGEHAFKGRTTEEHQIDIPMKELGVNKTKNVYLQKDGTGRMYYRIGMNYAPKSLFLAAASHGFTVQRAYEPVDDDGDVKRRADGSWEIKAGAKVKIKLTMLAPTRRYHVALVDPLPAGLETLNPALAVVGDIPESAASSTGRSNSYGWWWFSRPWYEHQNMRDERTEAFSTLVWGGVHNYEYYARATTPGEFVVPPTKAEEMYHPETFGRSASDRVHVVE